MTVEPPRRGPAELPDLTREQLRADINLWIENLIDRDIQLDDARRDGDFDAIVAAEADRDRAALHLARLIDRYPDPKAEA